VQRRDQQNTGIFAQRLCGACISHQPYQAMADNQILQIVVFSIFFGVATTAVGDYGKPVVKGSMPLHIIY